MIHGYTPMEPESDGPVQKRRIRPVFLLLILLFVFGFLFAAIQLVRIFLEYGSADTEYDIIRNDYTQEVSGNDVSGETDPFPDLNIDVDGLLAQNPDFLCWLYYEDMDVSYPVMLEPEGEYNKYLHMTFEGESNYAGTLFVPPETDPDFLDLNSFIYGHNMHNGSMFGTFNDVYNNMAEQFVDPYFYIWTRNHEKIMYRVVAMYVVDKDSMQYAVPHTDEGYDTYLEQMLSFGSVESVIPFTEDEQTAMSERNPIVSLSTCYGPSGTSRRLLVQGVEVLRMPF